MKYTSAILQSIVKDCVSMRQLLLSLGLKDTGGNRMHIKSRLTLFGINTEHFLGQGWKRGLGFGFTKEEFIEKVLNNRGGGWHSHQIKLKLYKFGLKEEKCEKCGQLPVWNGEVLSLQLNHKDGDNFNYILTNLEILCPNCHSQTGNFAGKKCERDAIRQTYAA